MEIGFISAALSLDVYRDKNRPPLPEGWSILFDCPKQFQNDGYFGAVYIYYIKETQQYQIVLAHKGTQNWHDYIEDVEMFLSETVPAQFFNGVIPFVEYTIQYINKAFGINNYNLYITGHSLGASLAELSFAKFYDPTYQKVFMGLVINFECPGTKPLIQQLINQGKLPKDSLSNLEAKLITTNTDINAINSCFEHVNQQRLYPTEVGYSYEKDPIYGYPLSPNLWYFLWDFTVEDQHSMIKIYNYFKNNPEIKIKNGINSGFQWPIGVNNAYKYYLNYNPYHSGYHEMYWDKYIQICWNNHPEIHQYYENEENLFQEDFVKNVLRHDYDYLALHPKISDKISHQAMQHIGMFAKNSNQTIMSPNEITEISSSTTHYQLPQPQFMLWASQPNLILYPVMQVSAPVIFITVPTVYQPNQEVTYVLQSPNSNQNVEQLNEEEEPDCFSMCKFM